MFPPRPRSTLFPYTTLFRAPVAGIPTVANHPWCVGPDSACDEWPAGAITTAMSGTPDVAEVKITLGDGVERSEEHTSELQSLRHLVCRLLLEKKNSNKRLVRGPVPRSEGRTPHRPVSEATPTARPTSHSRARH